MAKVSETTNESQVKSELLAGLKLVSGDQTITFKKYTRAVLPIDGYIFWVADAAIQPIIVKGSLHYSTDQQQKDDETIGINKVVFSTDTLIAEFNSISQNEMWIGEKDLIRFGFTSCGSFYDNAGIYHYRGDAIYPAMYSQIIDLPAHHLNNSAEFDPDILPLGNPTQPLNLGGLIATNSLPLWLGLNKYATLYPAMLLPSNLQPPYLAVDITQTRALQAAPTVTTEGSNQLMTEKVKITSYGLRNNEIIDFHNYILDYSAVYDVFGIMNMPTITDEKRGQSELGILAQKKSVEYEISYNQQRVQSVAMQNISKVIPNYTIF